MREKLLELLNKEFDALDIMTIYHKLELNSTEELTELQNLLIELEKSLDVYLTKKNKYILYSKCPNFKKGKIQVKDKGFGFVIVPGEEDIFVNSGDIGFALDDDLVLVEVIGTPSSKGEKREGRVIKILERDLKNVVGEIKSDGTNIYFEPRDKRNFILNVDPESLKGCVEGEVVVVQILECDKKNRCLGKVAKHICHKDDPQQDILSIAATHGIYQEFPDEVLEQIESIPNEVSESDLIGRVDLRDEMIFTIDGADTKDIDDAISYDYDPIDNVHILGVHIADVSYYIPEGSPLDDELIRRGTSNYLANTVIPMLPHKLSNGICSLNPNVDRCALSCVLTISPNGVIVKSEIFPSVIRSNKKMTYTDVNKILENDEIPEGYEPFAENLKDMQKLAHKLRSVRSYRGASDFDVPEAKLICDETGKCIGIEKRERGEGERLIEDFMIAANEGVAKRFATLGLPSIYRIHDVPKPEKVQSYISFCEQMGIHIKGKFNNITTSMFKKLIDQAISQCNDDKEKEAIMRSMGVRAMCKAVYSETNYGHFGLASECYTHYTSPIRRLCDFIVHRLIRIFLVQGKVDDRTINRYANLVVDLAKQASDREQEAVQAEREVEKMKMCEYMEDHIGEEFTGVITGAAPLGFFVQLPNLVEGLVPVASLSGDYYEFVEELQCFIGKNTKQRFGIGDRVDVKCVAASKATSTIDFNLTKLLNREKDDNELESTQAKVLSKKNHGRSK